MEQYESNSHKSKGNAEAKPAEVTKKKEVRAVAEGAKTKKKGPGSKLAKIFLPEDVTDVKDYIIWSVLIPTAKNVLLDTINEVLGGGRRTSRSSILGGRAGYINYAAPKRSVDNGGGRRTTRFDYDDIIVGSSQDAHDILSELDALMDEYHVVSLADLYSAAGISCDYTYNYYGWKDISDARVVRDPDGWLLKFPKAIPIT